MLALPQWDLFIAEYCTELVTYFPSWPIMLALPQSDLFIAQHCTELVSSFPSWPIMLDLPQSDLFIAEYYWTCNLFSLMTYHVGLAIVRFIYSKILHWTCNLFSLMTSHAGLAIVKFIYSKMWSWCAFLHCRDRNEAKQKGKKRNIVWDAKKKMQHSTGGGGRPINLPKNISFWVVGFLACCPIQFWRGWGFFT